MLSLPSSAETAPSDSNSKRLRVVVQDPSAVPSWSLSSRRSHILRILDQVLSLLSSVEDSYLPWQQSSAHMEANLLSHLVGNQDQYNAFSQVSKQ